MVDSALPNKKTYKELEKELRYLLNKKREINFQLKKILKKEKKIK
jgi:hypothetical protein